MGLSNTVPNKSTYIFSAYIGKGYPFRDGTNKKNNVNSDQCKLHCKGVYMQDNLWFGCEYNKGIKRCTAFKNPRGFHALNSVDYWTIGVNLFFNTIYFIPLFAKPDTAERKL